MSAGNVSGAICPEGNCPNPITLSVLVAHCDCHGTKVGQRASKTVLNQRLYFVNALAGPICYGIVVMNSIS